MTAPVEWSIRTFLAPVITRMLIYGTNPFDIEAILKEVENTNIINSNVLQKKWLALWETKAERYLNIAQNAETRGDTITAYDMYLQTAQCYYAVFLINFVKIEDKKNVYLQYARYYDKALTFLTTESKKVDISIGETSVPAYLHFPEGEGPFPCTILFEGLGSCKEEMHILAMPLLKRGIAVLVPDMPGCGEALFDRDIKCRMVSILETFKSTMDYACALDMIDSERIGVSGLCMGGGYAYKAASLDKRFAWCATLFPLYIDQVDESVTPAWMRQGPAYNFQTGGVDAKTFVAEMGLGSEEKVACPYFLIHGRHDNWMTIDNALELHEKATGPKELLILEDEPVYYQGIQVTHTMPVGEQLHWIKHVFADWIATQAITSTVAEGVIAE
ncbi:MAG: esterase FrsA [Fibrobacterales bacterium]